MSPVVKRKGERFTLPSKYLLFILTILCTIMMLVTFGTNVFNRPFNRVVGYVIVPFEQGIAKAGEWLANRSDELVPVSYTHLSLTAWHLPECSVRRSPSLCGTGR